MISTVAAVLMGAVAVASASEASCSGSTGGAMQQLEVENRSQFDATNYVYDLAGELNANNGQVASFNAGVEPALFDTYISSVMLEFNACDINLPHTHPRATEVSLVLEGELMMGFAEENGGQVHEYKVREGQVMVFPKGVLHYQLNDSCRPAKMYAVLNHHDPGTLTLPVRLNALDQDALLPSYGASPKELRDILGQAPTASPAPGSDKCLRKCEGKH